MCTPVGPRATLIPLLGPEAAVAVPKENEQDVELPATHRLPERSPLHARSPFGLVTQYRFYRRLQQF